MSNNRQREAFYGDEQHFLMYDIRNPSVENYISQVADCVHYVDLIHLRVHQVQTAFEGAETEYQNPKNLEYAKQIKAEGIETPIAAWTGYPLQ